MKRTLLSVKELAQETGISADSVYRAYRKGESPAAHICGMIQFDLEKVGQVMEKKAKSMPNSQDSKRATDAARHRRARKAPSR